jgi:tRNA A-37 threonylcarbamoyl transferase component Bud32
MIRKKMFANRIEAQEQIEQLCDAVFKKSGTNESINFSTFSSVVSDECSDLLISILTVIRDCLPCTSTFWENMNEYYKGKGAHKGDKTDVPSPKYLKQFSPRQNGKASPKSSLAAAAMKVKKGKGSDDEDSKAMELDIDDNIDEIAAGFQKQDEKLKEMEERMNAPGSPQVHGDAIRLANKTLLGKGGSSMLRAAASTTGKGRKERFSSPSRILSGDNEEDKDDEEDAITHSGQMHRESGERKLKGYWYRLRNRDLYYYKRESDEKYKGMYALTNVFLREEEPEPYDENNYVYSFTLIFVSKERRFYCLKKDEYDEWVKVIKSALGYYSISTYYDIGESIGKGKFGRVKAAVHKKTNKKVAVKILKKKKMDQEDFELYKREVEILKICQHPNIIRLLDVFENSEYIYIVMEHLAGGPLLTYFKDRKYKLKENRVRDIAHQIATALYYLKSFGIAHRDMKPDNIMMACKDEDSEIKLIDFGLSKIIGPKERSKDPFGTIPYAAPEIILRKPYSHSVDIWSLGVTIFFLMTGFHPFDSHDQQELLKKIVRQDPDWNADEWKGASDGVKDLVKKLLEKDKEKRIEIEQVLEHDWITDGNEKLRIMRRKSDTYLEKFNSFSLTKPEGTEEGKD